MIKPPVIRATMVDKEHTIVCKGVKIKFEPEEYKTLMTAKEAKQLKKYMRSVCTYGTASRMAYSSYKAYGKTGTAELDKKGSEGKINSWFVGFAKKGKKKIAIAVCLEDIKQGSGSATSVAKEILDSYFN